jgi:hypothetical protein
MDIHGAKGYGCDYTAIIQQTAQTTKLVATLYLFFYAPIRLLFLTPGYATS